MEKSTTAAGVVPAAIVEEAWQQVGVSFERFCLTAGIATLAGMMEGDAARLRGIRGCGRLGAPPRQLDRVIPAPYQSGASGVGTEGRGARRKMAKASTLVAMWLLEPKRHQADPI